MSDPTGVVTAAHNAFMLAWELVELKSRVQISACAAAAANPAARQNLAPNLSAPGFTTRTADPLQLLLSPNDSFWLASMWRAEFGRITALHGKTFPQSTTAKTLYAPPDKTTLPYLYPPAPDYADIGIAGVNGSTPILADFALYEVTRRAINCLTLLHVAPVESLIPAEVSQIQARLVDAVLKAARYPGDGGGDTTFIFSGDSNSAPAPASGEDVDALAGAGLPEAVQDLVADRPAPTPQEIRQAITVLSELTVKFLEAWDGYVRENYFAGGLLKDDETELVAYEAGRSMASLSWHISAETAVLEADAQTSPDALRTCWQKVFTPRAIVHAQHQITALSTTLDDAYYALHKDEKRPEEGAVLVWPDPDVPSQAIRAVKQSLDYWQRAIHWIATADAATGGQAASADVRPPAFTPQLSRQMRSALTEQADIWQSLLTGQQSLRAYSVESVTRKIIDDVLNEILFSLNEQLRTGAQASKRQFVQSLTPYLLIIGGIGLAFGIALLWALASTKSLNAATITASSVVPTVVSLLLGAFGLHTSSNRKEAAPPMIASAPAASPGAGVTGTTALMERISGITGEFGAALMQAFQDGYQQVMIEFTVLSQSVAVAYPLIEFFVITPSVPVFSDYAFITDIIWTGTDRTEEMRQVARAAFGPFNALLGVFASTRTGNA